MGRVPRPDFEGAFVHVFTRGNNRAPVFLDGFDYADWLALLGRTVKRFGLICHAYCVMPNHYHLLFETSLEPLSRGMRLLNGAFAQRTNLRYDRTGHLFERPYGLELVETDSHLLELCRYIPLNPVRAGLRERAADWEASSYRATAGLQSGPPFLTTGFVRSLFGSGERALTLYREFVAAGAASARAMSRDQVPGHGSRGQ